MKTPVGEPTPPTAAAERSYAEVVGDLTRASIPVRELHGRGAIAVTLASGRIVALAFSKDSHNLLWSNPELSNTPKLRSAPASLAGGFGGDRLWFSPELRYHWAGKPDWAGLANYHVPPATDPGDYRFVDAGPDVVSLAAQGRLPVQGSDQSLDFSVQRTIRPAGSPLSPEHMRGLEFVGVEATHQLTIGKDTRAGEIDLWHLLQTPVGSILIVPLRPDHTSKLLSYGLPGHWQITPQGVVWRITGRGNSKLGIGAAALTGRTAILRRLSPDVWCLIVRQFPVSPSTRYGDHPYGLPRHDQVFQAWDGGGFGEMEFHSPVLDAERGPRSLESKDEIWAFGGSQQAIAAVADTLLGFNIRPLQAE